MFDHRIQRYSSADQQAVYRWFIISISAIALVITVLGAIIIFMSDTQPIPICDSDIKHLEEQLKHAREQHDFIEQIQSKNQQQLKMLEQLALCIPDQVCLSEANMSATHVHLKGESYTYTALFEYQKALATETNMIFVIRSMDKQQELITFAIETAAS